MDQDALIKRYLLLLNYVPLLPIQTENYISMVRVLFSMYPIEDGIIVFQSIIKNIFVIGGALKNTIVLQFVQKLKKIDYSRQSK